MEQENVQFREIQRFRQTWMWLLIGGVAAIFWAEMVVGLIWLAAPGIIPGEPDREQLPTILAIWGVCWLLFGIGLPLLFSFIRLIVEVGDGGISVQYFPFLSRIIPVNDIKVIETRQFNPVRDYGGMGIKWSPSKGQAYIVDGNRGVWMELRGGEKLLIGSQRPEELLGSIQSMQSVGMRSMKKKMSV